MPYYLKVVVVHSQAQHLGLAQHLELVHMGLWHVFGTPSNNGKEDTSKGNIGNTWKFRAIKGKTHRNTLNLGH
jgi:hypothetical protein